MLTPPLLTPRQHGCAPCMYPVENMTSLARESNSQGRQREGACDHSVVPELRTLRDRICPLGAQAFYNSFQRGELNIQFGIITDIELNRVYLWFLSKASVSHSPTIVFNVCEMVDTGKPSVSAWTCVHACMCVCSLPSS